MFNVQAGWGTRPLISAYWSLALSEDLADHLAALTVLDGYSFHGAGGSD